MSPLRRGSGHVLYGSRRWRNHHLRPGDGGVSVRDAPVRARLGNPVVYVRGLQDAGGNFIDTANSYIDGTSEPFLGRFLEGRRDRFVLATKYAHAGIWGDPNGSGSHRKNLVRPREESLERLRTDYVEALAPRLGLPHAPSEARPAHGAEVGR